MWKHSDGAVVIKNIGYYLFDSLAQNSGFQSMVWGFPGTCKHFVKVHDAKLFPQ